MKRLAVFAWIESKLYMRSFYSPFFALAFPVMLLLLFGSIWGNAQDEASGFSIIDLSTAAFTGIVLAVNGLMNFPLNLAVYRERKVLKRLKATPASPGLLLVAHILVNVVMTAVGVILLTAVGVLGYGAVLPADIGRLVLALAISLAAMLSIGLLIGSLIASEKGASVVANIIYFPMIFLSGATLPIQMFPDGLKTASNVLPLTHGVNMIRGVWLGGTLSDFGTEMLILGAIAVVFTAVSVVAFRWE